MIEEITTANISEMTSEMTARLMVCQVALSSSGKISATNPKSTCFGFRPFCILFSYLYSGFLTSMKKPGSKPFKIERFAA